MQRLFWIYVQPVLMKVFVGAVVAVACAIILAPLGGGIYFATTGDHRAGFFIPFGLLLVGGFAAICIKAREEPLEVNYGGALMRKLLPQDKTEVGIM